MLCIVGDDHIVQETQCIFPGHEEFIARGQDRWMLFTTRATAPGPAGPETAPT